MGPFFLPVRALALLLALPFLTACVSPGAVAPSQAPQAIDLLDHFRVTGRLSVRHGEEGFSGGIEWRHEPASDDLLLLSPLGQGVARVVREPGQIVLTTSDQQSFRAADAGDLTEQILGWRLPLSGLAFWLQGAAMPGSPMTLERGEEGLPRRLVQDGWQVDYREYRAFAGVPRPVRVVMERGNIQMKLVIDDWRSER